MYKIRANIEEIKIHTSVIIFEKAIHVLISEHS